MTKKLLIANWKENPGTGRAALKLFAAAAAARVEKNITTVLCPPFVYLERCADFARRSPAKNRPALGAQDVFWENEGPYTGEVGPAMLRGLGVSYAIIGHSERRRWLGETDAMVNKKIAAALAAGLRAVLCVGEPVAIRKKGIAASKKFVKDQIANGLKNISLKKMNADRLIIAYEPIWAIGSGDNADPAGVRAMAAFIKEEAQRVIRGADPRVLYGGSVNGKNIAGYLCHDEVNGALVGGASLNAEEWKKIIEAAHEASRRRR